jgi:hypothetical protein
MKKRETIFSLNRIIALLLALYILNFSIDSPDAHPDNIAEDLAFNDIESFYEFILEDILGLEDAVAERDEHDPCDGGAFELKKVFLYSILSKVQANVASYLQNTVSPVGYFRITLNVLLKSTLRLQRLKYFFLS